jgi:OOP family OmpA-OmpF porin
MKTQIASNVTKSGIGRRVRALLPGAGVAVGLALASSPASAQLLEGAINVQKLSPAPGKRNFIVTRGARTDGEHAVTLGVLANFGSNPFVIATNTADTNVVQGLVTGDVLIAYTPVPIFQLGLRLPITYVKGNGVNPENGDPGNFTGREIEATGLSDPELEGKFRIVGKVEDPFVFGAALFLGAPLGEATAEGAYIGAESVSVGARLIADLDVDPLLLGANVGYRYKKEGRIDDTEFGPDLLYSAGAGVRIGPSVAFLVDLFGSSQFSDDPSTNAAEVLGALRIAPITSSWAVQLGGGVGLAQGSVGVPDYRALIGFGYSFESSDEDSDMLEDDDDQCPTEPEDVDGFEDDDGCPELDNDADAIMDDVDKCTNDAEDVDKHLDTDGCPEPDNDKDGVPDVGDRCADEAEAVNGFEDEDGCPDVPDKDSDGVMDDKDKCADQAEDTDGFEDVDGCPDPDNDGDGIPDERDECVDQAEDGKGKKPEEKEDGCPKE